MVSFIFLSQIVVMHLNVCFLEFVCHMVCIHSNIYLPQSVCSGVVCCRCLYVSIHYKCLNLCLSQCVPLSIQPNACFSVSLCHCMFYLFQSCVFPSVSVFWGLYGCKCVFTCVCVSVLGLGDSTIHCLFTLVSVCPSISMFNSLLMHVWMW